MNQILIGSIVGLISGFMFGTTGILPTALILIILDFFKIDEYKTLLGTILFLHLIPISIGSVFEFYKSKKINYYLGIILVFSILIGSYIGSKLVLGNNKYFSEKNIKYFTSFISFIIGFIFLYSAYHIKN